MQEIHYFKNATFVKSCDTVLSKPEGNLHEIVFVGKSNVGKSSLINSLVNMKNLAYTSSKPGMTRLLNYYLIENRFYFVDCPGYGFSSKKDVDYKYYGDMVEGFFDNNKNLKLIVFLLDSRHVPTDDDLEFYNFLRSYEYEFVIVMTKCDKLNMSEKSKIKKNVSSKLGEGALKSLLLVSVKDSRSLVGLKNKIESKLN